MTALPPGSPVHAGIDLLPPAWQGRRFRFPVHAGIDLLNPEGTVVGRLARRFEAPAGMRCVGAAVFAVVTRSRAMSDPQYLDRLKCDTWEVVAPELVFEPAGEPSERQAPIRGAD